VKRRRGRGRGRKGGREGREGIVSPIPAPQFQNPKIATAFVV